jgi:ABC-type Mn2+/Zn2+ transport system ATPase subunit
MTGAMPSSAADAGDLLRLRTVAVGYHGQALLPAIDLTVVPGTYLGVVGPNASGKTTLVRTMLGLLPPVSGRVEHPRGRPPRFGYVPQRTDSERSFPMTALDLVTMGRFPRAGLIARVSRRDRDLARACLQEVGLEAVVGKPLHTLSGGQRQRSLIARALATEPEVLILDEPTTGMDIVAESSLLALIEGLRTRLDLGVVIISHHIGLVASHAREVLLVDKDRQAVEHGPVDQVVTSERLSRLYGRPVHVQTEGDQRLVFLRPEPRS